MTGTLRRINSAWYVDHTYPKTDRPTMIGIRWRVTGATARGYSTGLLPELSDGLKFEYRSPNWQFYGGSGNYWTLETEQNGTVLPDVEIPCPRGIKVETRWYNGQWQKYLKTKGWIAA